MRWIDLPLDDLRPEVLTSINDAHVVSLRHEPLDGCVYITLSSGDKIKVKIEVWAKAYHDYLRLRQMG